MLSAASSYGFDIGISGGIRDWESTSRNEERATPQVMLTVGNTITPNSPFRVDAVAGAWTREERVQHYEYVWFGGRDEDIAFKTVERSGFAIGLRTQLDNRKLNENGHRVVRPVIGLGWMWTVQKDDLTPGLYGLRDQEYWNDQWATELMVGIAIPTARAADLLIQYTPTGVVRFNEGEIKTHSFIHSLSLGYRFAVWSER